MTTQAHDHLKRAWSTLNVAVGDLISMQTVVGFALVDNQRLAGGRTVSKARTRLAKVRRWLSEVERDLNIVDGALCGRCCGCGYHGTHHAGCECQTCKAAATATADDLKAALAAQVEAEERAELAALKAKYEQAGGGDHA